MGNNFFAEVSNTDFGDGCFITSTNPGVTKREMFAAMAMQGLASNPSCTANPKFNAETAVRWADELILALEKDVE